MPEIKLTISFNDKVIQNTTKEMSEHGFVKSIENFQIVANAAMTKLIEESGDTGPCQMEEDSDDSENEDNVCISPKKKKK